MLEILQPYLIEIIVGIITAMASYIGLKVKKIYETKINDDTKRKVVKTCVGAVEQLYKQLKGQEKLQKAKENIVLMLNEKGITITELEIDMLIEEAVNEFKQNVKKEG